MRGKTGLNWSEVSSIGETLDRDDVSALHLTRQSEAGQFWHTVDHDGATAARAQVTPAFDAKRADLVSQDIQQHGIARCKNFKRAAVHGRRPSLSCWSGNHGYVLFANHRPHPSIRRRWTL